MPAGPHRRSRNARAGAAVGLATAAAVAGPDMQCTLAPDGLPWGTGTEFLQCCIQHDLTADHWQFFECLWPVSPVFAVIYFAAVAGPLGYAFRLFWRGQH